MSVKKKLSSGDEMPCIGLGTWKFTEKECEEAIPIALEIGYRSIDTAYAYYNEAFIGPVIRSLSREELFLTSKLWREFHKTELVEKALDESLKALKIDYLDLYLIHWPERKNMVDILGQMNRMKEKGKVKNIGICNATEGHLMQILDAKIPIVVNQVEYHPYLNQEKLLAFCHAHDIALVAYSPLAQGEITKEGSLKQIGEKYQKTPSQVALRWLLQKDIVIIPKSHSKEHLLENFTLFDFTLDAEEMKTIDRMNRDHRTILPEFHEFF